MTPIAADLPCACRLGCDPPDVLYFVTWFQQNGWSLMAMVDAWHVNAATSGLVWDLTIAAIALTVVVLAECRACTNGILALLVIPATFCIGVSCGLPLYLFLRSKPD